MINVIANIYIKEGTSVEFLEAFNALLPIVHAEEGCIAYSPTEDVDIESGAQILNPNCYTVVEKWTSVEALNAHSAQQHMANFIESMKDVIEKLTLQVTKDI